VKGLCNITSIMNKKTESERLGNVFVVRVKFHQVSVHVLGLVALVRRISDPISNNPEGVSDVLGSISEGEIVK